MRGVSPHFGNHIEHLLAQILEAVNVPTILLKIHVFPCFLSVFGVKIEQMFEFRCKKRGLNRVESCRSLSTGGAPCPVSRGIDGAKPTLPPPPLIGGPGAAPGRSGRPCSKRERVFPMY